MGAEFLEQVAHQPIEGPFYLRAARVADEAAQLEVSEYPQMGEPMPGELM